MVDCLCLFFSSIKTYDVLFSWSTTGHRRNFDALKIFIYKPNDKGGKTLLFGVLPLFLSNL